MGCRRRVPDHDPRLCGAASRASDGRCDVPDRRYQAEIPKQQGTLRNVGTVTEDG
jgi:hypothetical protein